MSPEELDSLQGTLDLMVLQTLAAMGSQHGYGIAPRIEQVSGNEVLLNQGTTYPSLVRLEQWGWIDSEWGVSGNNRKAKFYAITVDGRSQLASDVHDGQRLSGVMDRIFAMAPRMRNPATREWVSQASAETRVGVLRQALARCGT
ncbi:MAG: PadR family transcriptional regulator [Acidobacteriota bacterium]